MHSTTLPRATRSLIQQVCVLAGARTDAPAAVNALHQTIKMVVEAGNFRQAADREKEIAQIYAEGGYDIRQARDSYQRAGDWYKQEDANA